MSLINFDQLSSALSNGEITGFTFPSGNYLMQFTLNTGKNVFAKVYYDSDTQQIYPTNVELLKPKNLIELYRQSNYNDLVRKYGEDRDEWTSYKGLGIVDKNWKTIIIPEFLNLKDEEKLKLDYFDTDYFRLMSNGETWYYRAEPVNGKFHFEMLTDQPEPMGNKFTII